MRNFYVLPILIAILILASCQQEEVNKLDDQLLDLLKSKSEDNNITYFAFPSSDDFKSIPQDPKSPITSEKVALGEMLFHETALGTDNMNLGTEGTYSCASCHHVAAGFQAGTFQGVGEGGSGFGFHGEGRIFTNAVDIDVQPIRSPTAMNGAYQEIMLWNGQFGATGLNIGTEVQWTIGTPKENNNLGYQGLETQAIAGLSVHRMNSQELVAKYPEYQVMFDKAFPEISTNKRYTSEYAGLAIAAYERTLLANQAPFQKFLNGNRFAMSDEEKEGAILFFGKANCVECHTGPALNKMDFYALGMKDLFECVEPTLKTKADNVENFGRGGFTKVVTDNYKFKVPQLYNLRDSPFYGHGATFRSIRDVIVYKNEARPQKNNFDLSLLDSRFIPLGLSELEMDQLATFIAFSLYDNNLNRYVPQEIPSGQCFPNNDTQSRIDIKCN